MRVFISAGEASGDAYGAEFVRELQRLRPSGLEFEGLGGRRMREAGVQLIADTGAWGAITAVHSALVFPRVVRGYYTAKMQMRRRPAGLFVPIDFGFANIRLARHAKNQGWKVLYFVPPGSWRRDRQGKDLVALTDAISTPFSWSAEILRAAGANAHWFGHPIQQLLRERRALADASPTERIALAILPGSRRHEIAENLPLIALALRQMQPFAVEFGLAPSTDVEQVRDEWVKASGRSADVFTVGDTPGVLLRARAAIVCSGTATLEAALCRCPMVVVYRVGRLAEIEAKIVGFKRPKYIALPNILLDRPVVPELLQLEVTPEAIASATRELLGGASGSGAQLSAFQEIETLLGPHDAITRTAELALSFIH